MQLDDVPEKASQWLIELQKARSSVEATRPSSINLVPVRWKPPISNSFKLNFDASFPTNGRGIGFGCVICNNNGEVVGACCSHTLVVFDPFTVECLALQEGLLFARSHSIALDIAETDCFELVGVVRGSGPRTTSDIF